MKLQFDPHLPHQGAAIDSVLRLWGGLPFVSLPEALAAGRAAGVVANRLDCSPEDLLARVQEVQREAGLPVLEAWSDRGPAQISVEMETGTGKTYVYLRTVLALARRHGVRKVVIVVPSVAVREGVLATLRSTREHFATLLPGLSHRFFAYDGARLSRLRTFVRSSQVELMVLTLDAFNKASNRMRQAHDGFRGHTPLELLQATRPLVVLDEPQRMESPRSRAAIGDLAPLCVLRYSATHRHRHALVHRLTPREAHERGLVKRIEVAAPAAGLDDRSARISAQLRTTIERHFQRQAELAPRGIKVLSLLFVPKVADWVDDEGLVRAHFVRHFDALKGSYPAFESKTAAQASAAYFAVARARGKSRPVDSRTGRSAADEDAYALIMRDKERLLSLDEPVCFVVSHSALREGWDNPNIFQICTMARSRSSIKKRQEVGRGIRLAVDRSGRRVMDPVVDVLTVVANDSYEEYVGGLQAEDAEEVGAQAAAPAPRPVGEGRREPVEAVVDDDGVPPWRRIDAATLRADAVAWLRRRSGAEDAEPSAVPEPVTRVTELLLQRHPPCLVSRPTIEALLEEVGSEGGCIGWRAVEQVAGAVVAALAAQRSAPVDPAGDPR